MREEIHRLATATAFRLKPEATLPMRGIAPILSASVASALRRKDA